MDGPILLKSTITPPPRGGADTAGRAESIALLHGCLPQACPPRRGGARVPPVSLLGGARDQNPVPPRGALNWAWHGFASGRMSRSTAPSADSRNSARKLES